MSPASLALALFLFVACCTGTLTGSAAASIKFPYASVDGPARYAGWVPTYTAAAAQSDLHRVTLYLTPSNPALLDVPPLPSLSLGEKICRINLKRFSTFISFPNKLQDMFWAVSDPESPQYGTSSFTL